MVTAPAPTLLRREQQPGASPRRGEVGKGTEAPRSRIGPESTISIAEALGSLIFVEGFLKP